ncbi:MAG TPA: SRPBCC family protein, partial [Acetobacteraceae bacterium]|nr:SRPBCC family protein [Acetobacteraceae bacterium]
GRFPRLDRWTTMRGMAPGRGRWRSAIRQGGTTVPNTVRLHRVLATRPEKVYRAFLEPDALAKWLPPNGFVCTVDHLEAKVGGTFRMAFRNFTTGNSTAFHGRYLELVPGERLRYTDAFEDPNLPGEIQVTVTLKKVLVGTEIDIVQSNLPHVIPPEACYLGWQESLRNLARLVEPEITQ